MLKRQFLWLLLLVGMVLSAASNSFSLNIQVDLNTFYADGDIFIAEDGTSATINGDGLLTNDPYLYGDPGIDVPTGLVSLSFDYSFKEGAENDDEFYAWIFNGNTGEFIDEFYVDFSNAGTVTWDLTGLSIDTTLLGM